jgi:PIN domain-containing protein
LRASGGGVENFVFFIDRSLGKHDVPAALRAVGAHIEIHDQHFAIDARDEEWILDVGRRGWIILTKDDNIRRRPLERMAVRAAQVSLFALGGGNLRGPDMGAIFARAMPKMVALLQRTEPPLIARVTKTGTVLILEDFADRR